MRTTTRIVVAAVVSVLAFGVAPIGSAQAKTVATISVGCCGGR